MNSVYQNKEDKSTVVKKLFNNIASRYDFLNSVMSLGLHKSWKKYAVNLLEIKEEDTVLDICCGSGDISELIAKKYGQEVKVTAVDFSEEMIKIAKKRLSPYKSISVVQADAYNLPFEEASFNHVIISFGLRNLENIPLFLEIAHKLIKNNGNLVILDFGKPENVIFKVIYNVHLSVIIPIIGKIYSRHSEYAYLPESVRNFLSPGQIVKLLKDIGFRKSFKKQLFAGFVGIEKGTKD